MKNAIVLTFALIILFSAGYWQINYIEESSIYAITDVEYVINLIHNDDFDSANKHLTELMTTWENMRFTWSIFIHHEEMDDIETALVNLKIYSKLENKDESLVHAQLVIQNLSHVSRNQKIKIENII